MERGAERVYKIAESKAIAMTRKARELKAKGEKVINLSIGEPDFDTPVHIRNAAIEAVRESFTHYPPVSGIPELREAVAKKFQRENNLPYKAENIVVSNGAKQSLANLMLALLNPGDEVMIAAPYWVTYPDLVKIAEGKPVFITSTIENDFKITSEQLEKAITPRTKMFLFSSPCNPSGTVCSEKELRALGEIIRKHPQIFIVSDEIYEHIIYGIRHYSIASDKNIFEQCITVNGVSKCFAMTGWRIGYIGAPKWVVDLCDKIQGQFTSGASSISQRAALAALTMDMNPTYGMRDAFLKRRDLVTKKLKQIKGVRTNVPQGAFYVFPEISAYFGKSNNGQMIHTAEDLCMYLLNEAKVSTVNGDAFGSPNHLRISYAVSDNDLSEAIDRIKISLEKLK